MPPKKKTNICQRRRSIHYKRVQQGRDSLLLQNENPSSSVNQPEDHLLEGCHEAHPQTQNKFAHAFPEENHSTEDHPPEGCHEAHFQTHNQYVCSLPDKLSTHQPTDIPPFHTIYTARQHGVSIEPFSIGPMKNECMYCKALRFPQEKLNCCHSGKISLPPLATYPEYLRKILTGRDEDSTHFKEIIRNYNSAFAFASMGASLAPPPGNGPYCFRIHGQIYHRVASLHPPDGSLPVYSQLYILEGHQAIEARMQHPQNQACKSHVMHRINDVLQGISPYAAAYKQLFHIEQEQQQLALQTNTKPSLVTMCMKRGNDQRRYNEPHHDEVAAIFIGDEGIPSAKRDIVIYPFGQPPTKIPLLSANCDPMVYPLLFPRGDLGWTTNMQHSIIHRQKSNYHNKITPLQFYSYRLAVRQDFSAIHYAGKLFQQYIVDAYVKTESTRLNYLRENQKKLRTELYSGLMDHVINAAEEHGLPPGKVVILPSSFHGSPRAMHQNYQDAMAIVAKYGKPDIFITVTCNPKSKDILENLCEGQRPHERPDIVARVFKLQLQALIHDIKKHHVLGNPLASVYVIEFQKRGLPHAHMLFILNTESKLRDAADIDTVISAEIPDKNADPELYHIVKTTMVHGPCGVLNPNAPCMENGICTKRYPKDFQSETVMAENGYPNYRRRDNGKTIRVGHTDVDNRWIVPYNPWLTKKYGSHINVEACTTVKSVKYLFKYIYKGHDCAQVEVHESYDHDEITTFLDCRYISAPEAFWRLSEFRMHEQSHTIVRLPVHLPQQQPVYFELGQEEEALDRASTTNTMLTAWFNLNRTSNSAHDYLYTEIPTHYIYDSKAKQWRPRKRGGQAVISRMYSVSPKDIERFCLRLLLLHVKGADSFEALRTVNGIPTQTFKETCQLLNLLSTEEEWDKALAEAATFQMPQQMRSLFAAICSHCYPHNVIQLWEKHKNSLSEDYLTFHGLPQENAENRALEDIDSVLLQTGTSAESLGLPTIVRSQTGLTVICKDSTDEAEAKVSALNTDQKKVHAEVIARVQDMQNGSPPQCCAFFLDGPGGTGKTTVYNALISSLSAQNSIVAPCAWTGIAATLLQGGRTVHSLFKLPIPLMENSVCGFSATSNHAKFLRSVDLFIVDEASMVPSNALNAINRSLQDIMQNTIPFGGKPFLLGGDFRQLLPVLPRLGPTAIVENCLKSSALWPQFQKLSLKKNMRSQGDQKKFAQWLLHLGNGKLERPPHITHRSPASIILPREITVLQKNILDYVFPVVSTEHIDFTDAVVLSPRNDDTMILNEQVLRKIPGSQKTYLSSDAALCEDDEEAQTYPIEFLNSLTPSGMPPHKLNLKPEAIVMLLRNLDLRKGLCNGTRMKICRLHSYVIDAEIISGSHRGSRHLIPRIKLAPSDVNLPFTLQRIQFPLRLAYSITINKAQGQTFNKVGIYLPRPVFSHGQLYVAFSRAKSFQNVFVHLNQTETQGLHDGQFITDNIVYKSVLG